MTIIVKEVYDAFVAAGVSPEMAKDASNSLIEHRVEIETMKRDIYLLKWMTGYLVALVTAIALKLFF